MWVGGTPKSDKKKKKMKKKEAPPSSSTTSSSSPEEKYNFSIESALRGLHSLMRDLVDQERCCSLLQRNYRGHRGYLMFRSLKALQVVARVTKEYMHWVDPWRDKVKEYWEKERRKEWNAWMKSSALSYQQSGWAIWEQKLDPVSGDYFYVNDQTGETMWEAPTDGTPYLPYVPPPPEEAKRLELQAYLEAAKRNIARIEAQAQEEARLREEARVQKRLEAFENGDETAFLDTKGDDEDDLDSDPDEHAGASNAWLDQAEDDAWAAWDKWMREQWEANKTPWHEVPHLDSGEFHYINSITGECRATPPPDGVFYEPFSHSQGDARAATGQSDIPDHLLRMMIKVKDSEDAREKAEVIAMYEETFQEKEAACGTARSAALGAVSIANQWNANEDVQQVVRMWSVETDERGRKFYYNATTGAVENEVPEEIKQVSEANAFAKERCFDANQAETSAIESGEAYAKRVMMFYPADSTAVGDIDPATGKRLEVTKKRDLLAAINKRVNLIRVRLDRYQAQYAVEEALRKLERARGVEASASIAAQLQETETDRARTILSETWEREELEVGAATIINYKNLRTGGDDKQGTRRICGSAGSRCQTPNPTRRCASSFRRSREDSN